MGFLSEISCSTKEYGDNRPNSDAKAQNDSPIRAIMGVSCFIILNYNTHFR